MEIKFLFHRKFTFRVRSVVLSDNSDVIFMMRKCFKTHLVPYYSFKVTPFFWMSLKWDWTLQCIIQGHSCSDLFTFVSAQLGESRRRACEKLLPTTRGVFSASNNAQLKYEAEQSPCLPAWLSATSSQWCFCLARLGAKAANWYTE